MLDIRTSLSKLSPDALRDRGEHVRARIDRARHDVHVARANSRVRLFEVSAQTLERANAALDDAPTPIATLTSPVKKAVATGLEATTRLPVSDYDSLNVKKVREAVRGLDLIDLARISRYERAHKNRKTVFAAIETEQERQLRAPVAA